MNFRAMLITVLVAGTSVVLANETPAPPQANPAQTGEGLGPPGCLGFFQIFCSHEHIARDSMPPDIFRTLNPFCKRMRVA